MHGLRRVVRLRLVQRDVIAKIAIGAAHLLHLLQPVHIGLVAKPGEQHHGFELAVVQRGLHHAEHGGQTCSTPDGVQRAFVTRTEIARPHGPAHQQLGTGADDAAEQAAQGSVRGAANVEFQQIVIFGVHRGAGHGKVAGDFLPVHIDHDLRVLPCGEGEGNALHVSKFDVQPERENLFCQRLQRNDTAQQLAFWMRDQIIAVGQADGDVLRENGATGQDDAGLFLPIRQGFGIVFFQRDIARFQHAFARAALTGFAGITNGNLMLAQQFEQVVIRIGEQVGAGRQDVDTGHERDGNGS
jgi:hypothetical protein